MSEPTRPGAEHLAIFASTRDLAKTMTYRALDRLEEAGQRDCPIIRVGHGDRSEDHLAASAREALAVGDEAAEKQVFGRLAVQFSCRKGNFSDKVLSAMRKSSTSHDEKKA